MEKPGGKVRGGQMKDEVRGAEGQRGSGGRATMETWRKGAEQKYNPYDLHQHSDRAEVCDYPGNVDVFPDELMDSGLELLWGLRFYFFRWDGAESRLILCPVIKIHEDVSTAAVPPRVVHRLGCFG
ncbi:unnamed protein product [Pleuronectes platessa]|uniref:Uncharacterized protein n=1 Tax=Pleuronectes platessa TaxID=8262 RepID=A0A9N7U7T7_PLEPL|nr:unnamed protein product [Pleuronectes platessa]